MQKLLNLKEKITKQINQIELNVKKDKFKNSNELNRFSKEASETYGAYNTFDNNEGSHNIDLKGVGLGNKKSTTDFEALDDITPLPPKKTTTDSESDNPSPKHKSLSKLEMRLNSIKRVPKDGYDSQDGDSIQKI